MLVPGVIDTCTSYVEHPELVAERIVRFAHLVGRERVIAGTDCGLANFASYQITDPKIAWMKLAALVEGAALAPRAGSGRRRTGEVARRRRSPRNESRQILGAG